MKAISKITAIFDYAVDFLAYSAGVVIIFVMLSIATEVISRAIFNVTIYWVVEISESCVLYITFMSAAYLLKNDWHVRVDLVLNQLDLRKQAILNMVTSTIGAALFLLFAYRGALSTLDLWQRGAYTPTIMELPLAPFIAIIFIGSSLLSIQFMRRVRRYMLTRRALAEEIEGGRVDL